MLAFQMFLQSVPVPVEFGVANVACKCGKSQLILLLVRLDCHIVFALKMALKIIIIGSKIRTQLATMLARIQPLLKAFNIDRADILLVVVSQASLWMMLSKVLIQTLLVMSHVLIAQVTPVIGHDQFVELVLVFRDGK